MRKFLVSMICILFLCGCRKDVGPNATPAMITPPGGTPTIVLTPTVKPTVTASPLPTIEPKVTPVPVPTGMPKRKVKLYDETAGTIPVAEEYFSDEAFRAYILQHFDTDKDGMLSVEERREVTQILVDGLSDEAEYAAMEMDGLDWFQDLEFISFAGGCSIVCENHPSLRTISGGESGGSIWLENCQKLESVGLSMFVGSLYVKDCSQLQELVLKETKLDLLYLSETPNLAFELDSTNQQPSAFYLDRLVKFYSDCNFVSMTEEAIPKYTWNVNWIGSEQNSSELKDTLEQMRKMAEIEFQTICLERVEIDKYKHTTGEDKAYQVYFGNLGDSSNAHISLVTDKEVVAEDFSMETKYNSSKGTVSALLVSGEGASVYSYGIGAEVHYRQKDSSENLGVVSAKYYFVVEPGKPVEMVESTDLRVAEALDWFRIINDL